jgi:NADH-quinone oxidoreductase subunit E
MEERLRKILSAYGGRRDEVIPILQKVQSEYSYLPEDVMMEIAKFTRVPESNVYGVASFYGQFRFTPMGKKLVMVCRGTACHVRGAPKVLDETQKVLGIKEGETTKDREYSLETVACIGCCALSPCMTINKDVYAKLTPNKVRDIFGKPAKSEGGESA